MNTSLRKWTALFLAPALLVMLAAAAVLTDPAPIPVPAGLSEKAVEDAIRLGGIQRGWIINKEGPGQFEATLNIRTHQAKVGIRYDSKQVQFSYRSSSNLDYSDRKGTRYIHANYLKWVQNLANDIGIQLQLADVKQS